MERRTFDDRVPRPATWRVLQLGYLTSLRRACARPASGRRLLAFALGPDAHWVTSVLTFVPPLAGTLPLLLVVSAVFETTRPLLWTLAGFALLWSCFFPLFHLSALRRAVWNRRREQALVRLAPRMPQGREMNAALGRALLAPFVYSWCVGLAGPLVLALVVGGGSRGGSGFVVTLLVVLPLAGLTLEDYARVGRPSVGEQLAVLAGVAVASVFLGAFLPAGALPALALGSLAAAALYVGLRWRRMLAAPPAFPAGRLAP